MTAPLLCDPTIHRFRLPMIIPWCECGFVRFTNIVNIGDLTTFTANWSQS